MSAGGSHRLTEAQRAERIRAAINKMALRWQRDLRRLEKWFGDDWGRDGQGGDPITEILRNLATAEAYAGMALALSDYGVISRADAGRAALARPVR